MLSMYLYHAKLADAEKLEKVLFGRRRTADWLEKLALSFAETGHATHPLLIGNRGSGKSHLLRVLYNRIVGVSAVQKNVVIAYLEEDPYGIADYLDLLRRIIKAIGRAETDAAKKKALNAAHQILIKTAPEQRIATAERILLDHLAGRRMLLLIENLNDIFVAMKEPGQSRWRDFLQTHDNTMIVATSQAIFSDIQSRQRPFFGFFHLEYLQRLTFEEARDLLLALAEIKGHAELAAYLDTPEGAGKLHAVFDLTEGNHRLLVTFYDFFISEYKSELSRSFLQTVDNMKPYYESFLKILPAQQQKIVQFLALERMPQTGTAIAENCFLPPTTVSKQMSELQRLGYVRSDRLGRDAYYEITEPMLRMCLEANENTDGILGLFVDFLGSLYSSRELKEKYLLFNILKDCADPELRPKIADEAYFFGKALPRYARDWQPAAEQLEALRELPSEERDGMIKQIVAESEAGYFNFDDFNKLLNKKDINKAEKMLEESLPDKESVVYKLSLAQIRIYQNRTAETTSLLQKILEIRPELDRIWYALGMFLYKENRLEEVEVAFRKALEIKPDKYEVWFSLGKLLITSLRFDEAKNALQKMLDNCSNEEKWIRFFLSCILMHDPEWSVSAFKYYKGEDKGTFLGITLFVLGFNADKTTIVTVLQHPEFLKFIQKNKTLNLPKILELSAGILLEQEDSTPARLRDFHAVLQQLYGADPAFYFPLKFLDVGIRHIKEKDPKALFDLTLEERRAFEQFVLDKTPDEGVTGRRKQE